MARYPPLISGEEMVHRHDDNLPLLHGPGIVSDIKGRVLLWYLPQILSEPRQVSPSHLRKPRCSLTNNRQRSSRIHEFSKPS